MDQTTSSVTQESTTAPVIKSKGAHKIARQDGINEGTSEGRVRKPAKKTMFRVSTSESYKQRENSNVVDVPSSRGYVAKVNLAYIMAAAASLRGLLEEADEQHACIQLGAYKVELKSFLVLQHQDKKTQSIVDPQIMLKLVNDIKTSNE